MALWSAFKSLVTGNFSDAGSYLFLDEDAVTTQKEVNDNLSRVLADQQARGVVSAEEAEKMTREIQLNAYPELFKDNPPITVFADELSNQAKNLPDSIANALNKTVSGVTRFSFKALPWWVWGLILLGIVIYLQPFLAPLVTVYARRRRR